MIQGSDEWFSARLGRVTASRVADVTARTKSGWGADRASYMAQLIAERLTGEVAATYTNGAMQHGTETEPEARRAYAWYSGLEVEEVGFVEHPTINWAGASPDGFVGTDGLVEIKCPATHTHIDTLLGQSVPGKYIMQMQWQMACTGRRWCDFVSFDPRMPEAMRFFVRRVERDDEKIADLERMVRDFLAEVEQKVGALRKLYDPIDFGFGRDVGGEPLHPVLAG